MHTLSDAHNSFITDMAHDNWEEFKKFALGFPACRVQNIHIRPCCARDPRNGRHHQLIQGQECHCYHQAELRLKYGPLDHFYTSNMTAKEEWIWHYRDRATVSKSARCEPLLTFDVGDVWLSRDRSGITVESRDFVGLRKLSPAFPREQQDH